MKSLSIKGEFRARFGRAAAVKAIIMKACAPNRYTGKLFNIFILILTKCDKMANCSETIQFFIEKIRVPTHITNKVDYSGSNLRIDWVIVQ